MGREVQLCGARASRADIVDERPGYVTGASPGRPPSWGREARPGTAHEFVYPRCRGRKVVADVIRIDTRKVSSRA